MKDIIILVVLKEKLPKTNSGKIIKYELHGS